MYEGKIVLTCEHRVCSCLVKAEAIETAFGDLVANYVHVCLEDMVKQIVTKKPFIIILQTYVHPLVPPS